MACHMRLFFLCFLNGNGVFPFLGAPADYFNLFLALDSVFYAILSLGFEFWCHFQHWLEFLQAILSTGFAFWRHFEHRVRVFLEFFTISVTGFEFLCNSDQMVRILGAPGQDIFRQFEQRVRVLGTPGHAGGNSGEPPCVGVLARFLLKTSFFACFLTVRLAGCWAGRG